MSEIRSKKSNTPHIKIHIAENKMFPLDIANLGDCAFAANMKDESWFWHLRYGHLHFNGLKLLSQKQMVCGLPSIVCTNDVCEG